MANSNTTLRTGLSAAECLAVCAVNDFNHDDRARYSGEIIAAAKKMNVEPTRLARALLAVTVEPIDVDEFVPEEAVLVWMYFCRTLPAATRSDVKQRIYRRAKEHLVQSSSSPLAPKSKADTAMMDELSEPDDQRTQSVFAHHQRLVTPASIPVSQQQPKSTEVSAVERTDGGRKEHPIVTATIATSRGECPCPYDAQYQRPMTPASIPVSQQPTSTGVPTVPQALVSGGSRMEHPVNRL
jgi:hypothetical protein